MTSRFGISCIIPLTMGLSAIGCTSAIESTGENTEQSQQAVVTTNAAQVAANAALYIAEQAGGTTYGDALWSSQAYAISAGKMVFNPNFPGYSAIPEAAVGWLDAIQNDSSTAAYLTGGLNYCYTKTNGALTYGVRLGTLQGLSGNATITGSIHGVAVPYSNYKPSGYNPANVVDTFVTTGLAKSGKTVNVTLTCGGYSPSSAADFWFGMGAYEPINNGTTTWSTAATIMASYNSGGQAAGCSPFNGPGGTTNPYFVISLNGAPLSAMFTQNGIQCYSGARPSTLVVDPTPYASVGAYYNSNGLVGLQTNPFSYDPTQGTMATPDHYMQYACMVNSPTTCGTFSVAALHKTTVIGYTWAQCGTAGAGC